MHERPSAIAADAFAALLAAYAAPERYYHGLAHIEAMLEAMGRCRHLLHDAEAVELAIWFHDAVYDAKASDNEEKSAALARQVLQDSLAPTRLARIEALILATKRHELDRVASKGERSDMAHFLDLDLHILGAAPAVFDTYEAAVRLEYAHVGEAAWRVGRAAVLQRFAARPRLYFSAFFAEQLEERARANLAHSIEKLGPA
jgi:predicted metal-dependent HD superfamily phosphohydrolase